MTQRLYPLFGEYSTDQAIARGAANQPGIIAQPTLVLTGPGGGTPTWSIGLGANASLGFWGWRTPWNIDGGTFTIMEDATVVIASGVVEPAAGLARHILLVGRWSWVAGAVGSDGEPLGTFADAQHAVYEAISGADSATPADPSVPTTDGGGRKGVVLARIILAHGAAPVIQWIPETMLDLSAMGTAIEARHRRVGDEAHTGRFKVSEPPMEDTDTLRLVDLATRSVKSNASMVYFWLPVPDSWGSDPFLGSIGGTNAISASGDDIVFDPSDPTLLDVGTDGYYEFLGETHSQYNTDLHDMRVQIWKRPAGTSGPSDVKIYENGQPNNQGGIDSPVFCVVSAVVGDKFYLKAVGKRSLGAYVRCSFMGTQAATMPLDITTGDWTGMELSGQTYPKIVTQTLTASNAVGAVSWAITGGTGAAFASVSGATLTINFPSTGTWTLDLQATDASLAVAAKTITLTLNAYGVVTLVITTTDKNFVAYGYPYSVSFGLTSSGGDLPITWAVVADADTTLPSAAVSGSTLTGSVSAGGTWTVKVQATDSASTPQVVTKIITVTVEDWTSGDVCFEADSTYVLMADGTGRILSSVSPGEKVLTLHEESHERGMRGMRPFLVTDLTLKVAPAGEPNGIRVNGIECTPGHTWAIPGQWARADRLKTGDAIVGRDGTTTNTAEAHASVEAMATPIRRLGSLGTKGGTFMVGATATGPWFLVHNVYYGS